MWVFGVWLHILVLQEYLVLTESKILFKPMLGGVRADALLFPLNRMNRLNERGPAVFQLCRLPLFWKVFFDKPEKTCKPEGEV